MAYGVIDSVPMIHVAGFLLEEVLFGACILLFVCNKAIWDESK